MMMTKINPWLRGKHTVSCRVGRDGRLGLPSIVNVDRPIVGVPILGCEKTSAGRFVLRLPHSPDRAVLMVETVPALPTNDVGKIVTRVSELEAGDVWTIWFDRLVISYDPVSGLPSVLDHEPHDSGFDFMLLWEDER